MVRTGLELGVAPERTCTKTLHPAPGAGNIRSLVAASVPRCPPCVCRLAGSSSSPPWPRSCSHCSQMPSRTGSSRPRRASRRRTVLRCRHRPPTRRRVPSTPAPSTSSRTSRLRATCACRETIVQDFGVVARHGIERVIPLRDDVGDHKISHLVVSTSAGTPDHVAINAQTDTVTIRIGDADTTITGAHTYRLAYDIGGMIDGMQSRPVPARDRSDLRVAAADRRAALHDREPCAADDVPLPARSRGFEASLRIGEAQPQRRDLHRAGPGAGRGVHPPTRRGRTPSSRSTRPSRRSARPTSATRCSRDWPSRSSAGATGAAGTGCSPRPRPSSGPPSDLTSRGTSPRRTTSPVTRRSSSCPRWACAPGRSGR